jgi:hypothetical protein
MAGIDKEAEGRSESFLWSRGLKLNSIEKALSNDELNIGEV